MDGGCATDENTPIIRVLFNDPAAEHSFNDMVTVKPLFQGMLYCMTSNKVLSGSHAFANGFDIQYISVCSQDSIRRASAY